jgi:hypothetical protein
VGLLPIVVFAFLAVAVATLVAGRSTRQPAVSPSPEQERVARTAGRWRLAGAGTGLVVAIVAAYQGALGRGLLLAAPLFGLCVLAGVIVGELRVRPNEGAERRATLEVRRVRDYLPRALGVTVAAATVVLGVVLVLTTAAGSPDDLGRAGRDLFRRCSAMTAEGHGPWPGSFYALPLAVVVTCGVLIGAVAMIRIVRRPAQSGDPAAEDALRRSAARSVTAAVGILVAVPLAGVGAVAGMALAGFGCRPDWWIVPMAALAVVVPAALALAAWCAAALLAPTPTRGPVPSTPAAR